MWIMPAILTDNPAELEKMVRQVESFTDWIQIDIMDGLFVPSRSITASHLAQVRTALKLEVHLMVVEPAAQLEAFQKAGARRIIFHYEAVPDAEAVIRQARDLGLGVGLAINPETPLSTMVSLQEKVDALLLLSVYPGFYGREFIPEVLDKVRELRALGSQQEVGMDGGINAGNIKTIKEAGVDYACVGSAIFHHPSPRKVYETLVALARDD